MYNSLEEQFLILEKALMLYRKADFEKLLSDDYIEFGSSGRKYDKATQLNSLTDNDALKNIPFIISDFKVNQIASNIVHTTYCTQSIETNKKSLRSSIWQFNKCGWQMYFHQGTPLA